MTSKPLLAVTPNLPVIAPLTPATDCCHSIRLRVLLAYLRHCSMPHVIADWHHRFRGLDYSSNQFGTIGRHSHVLATETVNFAVEYHSLAYSSSALVGIDKCTGTMLGYSREFPTLLGPPFRNGSCRRIQTKLLHCVYRQAISEKPQIEHLGNSAVPIRRPPVSRCRAHHLTFLRQRLLCLVKTRLFLTTEILAFGRAQNEAIWH